MKKALLTILVGMAITVITPVFAQRHVKQISALGVHWGRTEKGKFFEVSFAHYLTNKLGIRANGMRENGHLGATDKYSAFSSRLFLAPEIYRIREIAFFHLLLGGSGSYERTSANPDDSYLNNVLQERFTYGPQAGAEVDVFFGNRWSLVISGMKGKLFNDSSLDEWPGYGSLGLRYHFR